MKMTCETKYREKQAESSCAAVPRVQEEIGLIFFVEGKEIYTLFSSPPPFTGTLEQQALSIAAEFVPCNLVSKSRPVDAVGWSSQLIDRLESRKNELRALLMDVFLKKMDSEITKEQINGN